MFRVWTWVCICITAFFLLACGSAFIHLYTHSGAVGSEADGIDPITRIGYVVGERIFSYAEDQPGMDYSIILDHPFLFALGLVVVLIGAGSGVWLIGIGFSRTLLRVFPGLKRNAEQDAARKPSTAVSE